MDKRLKHNTTYRIKVVKHKILDFASFFNNIETYAASLSLYSLSAIIPLVIIILSILSSIPNFQGQVNHFKQIILSNISPTNVETIAIYLDQFMLNAKKSGVNAFIYALVISILFFRNLEKISSTLFESKKRSFLKSISIYWTLITLMPIGMSASIYFSLKAQPMLVESNLIVLFKAIPYCSIWALFFILFKILANKPLPFISLAISSFITMVAWSALKHIFIYQILVNKTYATIYGSFAMVMFSILWIYCSWIIILYGMRLTQWFTTTIGDHNKNM